MMRTERIQSIAGIALPAVAVLALAVYVGVLSASSRGMMAMVLVVPLGVFLLRTGYRERRWAVMLAVMLAPIQTPQLPVPLAFSASELLLIGVAFAQLAGRRGSIESQAGHAARETPYPYLAPFALFALAGLVPAVVNGEVHIWHTVALVPLLMIYLMGSLVRGPEAAAEMLRCALMAIVGLLLLLWLADLTGGVEYQRSEFAGRFGSSVVNLGPIRHVLYSVVVGTLMALGLPTAILLLLRPGESVLGRVLYGAMMVILAGALLLTAARAASVAALAGVFVVLFFPGRMSHFSALAGLAATAAALLLFVLPAIQDLSPYLDRFRDVQRGLGEVDNFRYRLDVLSLTVENTLSNPLGYGFNYLWVRYRIDEAIAYSALLNGAGLMGFASFLFVVGHLGWHFIRRIFSEARSGLAAVGLGTLVTGLVAGVGSESVVLGPVNSLIFWAILAAAYAGTRLPDAKASAQEVRSEEGR